MLAQSRPVPTATVTGFPSNGGLVLSNAGKWAELLTGPWAGPMYAIQIAGEAAGALAKIHARRPDLIVADLECRDTDGLPLAYGLLAAPGLVDVPVIALTADPAVSRKRQEMGDLFDDYFLDPVDPAGLLRQMQLIFSIPAAVEPNTDPPDFAGSSANPRVASYLRHARELAGAGTLRGKIAFRSLIRLCGDLSEGSPEPSPQMEALRSDYLENRRLEFPVLASALRAADFGKLASAGHNLKGTGAAYGFSQLTELGRALELGAKAKDALRVEVLLGRTEFYLGLVSLGPICG